MMIGLRIIDASGTIRIVELADIAIYRSCMGAFGIITHVKLRLTEAHPITFQACNDKIDFMSIDSMNKYFDTAIRQTFSSSGDDKTLPIFAQQFFVHMEEGRVLRLAWTEHPGHLNEHVAYNIVNDEADLGSVPKPLALFEHMSESLHVNYRASAGAKLYSRLAR
jgi:hypothetical protein